MQVLFNIKSTAKSSHIVKKYLVKVCAVLIEDGVVIVSASHWAEVGIEYVRASSVEKRLQVNLRESDFFSLYLTQILVIFFGLYLTQFLTPANLPHYIDAFWILYLTQFGTESDGVGEITKLFSTTGVKALPWLWAWTISI